MSTLFNADTSDGLKITSDTSGEILFQSAGVTKAGVNGTGLTGDASQLTALAAANLTGTVADARISTLTASKLTGALPAISGASLTGITSGGMTLLSTVATTSGTEVVAGSLTLTGYQSLMIYASDVGAAAGGSLFQWKETGGTYSIVAYSNLTSSVPVYAVLNHNLITGVTAINPNSYTATNTNANLNLQAGSGGCGTNTAIDQATTSITFGTVGGQTFNRGQILIYGLK